MGSTDSGDPYSYFTATFLAELLSAPHPDYPVAAIIIIFLLLCSAVTSAAEVAFFSITPAEILKMEKSTEREDKLVLQLLDRPRRLLATILALNTFINLSIITITGYLAWGLWHQPLAQSIPLVLLVALLLTGGIVFFGEVVPKVYAEKKRLGITRRTASLFRFFEKLLFPLTWFLLKLGYFIEEKLKSRSYQHAVDELHEAIEATMPAESNPEEKIILKGLITFSSISAKQIMRGRTDVVAFSVKQTLPELIPLINKWEYSRVPVYNETLDKIEGILYVKDLLPHLGKGKDFAWQELLHQPVFVPEGKRINDLLRDFQETRVHMAIVVDEYGGTSGIVTLEDVIEEIVGEINDEFDLDEDILYSQLDENTFVFEGKASIHDFCKITGVPYDSFTEVKGENESVGGVLLNLFGHLPRVGDQVEFGRFLFTVESVDNKRVKRIKANVAQNEKAYYRAG